MKPAYRKAIVILAAGAGLIASPAMGQPADGTIVIDGSGVHSASDARTTTGSLPAIPPRGGAPARASLPFNTPQGAVLAGQDTSLAPRPFSKSDRIVLRPPGSGRSTTSSSPQRAAPVLKKPAPQAGPKAETARAEPVRPAPKPQPKPEPVAKAEPSPAPRAPEKVEPPAREVTRPAAPAAPAPAAQPKPAEPVKEETRVAAVTPPAAAPDVNRLLFEEGAEEISAEGRARLEQIAASVRDDRDIRLQVMSYADSASETGDSNRRVSLRRAGNVRRVLLDNGIESFRILVRALGAPGPDDNGPGNRVDILIGRR